MHPTPRLEFVPHPSRKHAVVLLVLSSLLAVLAFIHSPWHRHSVMPGQLCSFNQLEQGTGSEARSPLLIEAPTLLQCLAQEAIQASPLAGTSLVRPGRAPPA